MKSLDRERKIKIKICARRPFLEEVAAVQHREKATNNQIHDLHIGCITDIGLYKWKKFSVNLSEKVERLSLQRGKKIDIVCTEIMGGTPILLLSVTVSHC